MRIVHFIFIPLLALSSCRSAPAPAKPPAQQTTSVTGEYKTGGDCAQGSPENPTCISTLTLAAGGKGSYIGDDIVEPATWQQSGKRITVVVGTTTFELTVNDDGTLVDNHKQIWKRSP